MGLSLEVCGLRWNPHPPPSGAPSPLQGEGFAGGSWTRPYGGYRSDCVVLVGAGPRPARQDLHRERWLGKARRRSGTAPVLIFANPGPSGPGGIAEATQILRAGNDAQPPRRASPRNGVRGKATMSTKCSSGAVPGGVLVPLPPWAKELAARRRRNPLRKPPEAARRGRRALQGCRKKTISSPAPPGRQSSG